MPRGPALWLAVALLGAAAGPVSAELRARALPVRYDLTAEPGRAVQREITISNQGDAAVVVQPRWSDMTVDTAGRIGLLPPGTLPVSLASVASVEPAQFSLQPGEEGRVLVTLTLPADGPPTLWGVLLNEVRPAVVPAVTLGPLVVGQLGTTFYLSRIPRERIQPELTGLSGAPLGGDSICIRASVNNPGERHFHVGGRVSLADSAGRAVLTGELPTGVVLPGQTRHLTWTGGAGPPPGRYLLTATLDSGEPELIVGETWMDWHGGTPSAPGPRTAGAPAPPGRR